MSLKSIAFAAGLAVAALSANNAMAQAQRTATPAGIALAKEIIAVKGGGDLINSIVPTTIDQAKLMFMQTNLNLQKDLTEVAAKVLADFKARSSEPMDEMARQYALAFTEAELKDIVAFYRSPLGKKVIEQEPKVLQASMQFADGWAQKLEPEIIDRFRTEMKKRGKDL